MLNDKSLITRQYLEGVDIFKEGDDAIEAFIIEDGEIQIYKTKDGKEQEVATFKNGDIFGEMALIRKEKHSSNARALKRTNLVIISEKTLSDKMKDADPLIAGLVHLLVKRLHQSNVSRFESEKG